MGDSQRRNASSLWRHAVALYALWGCVSYEKGSEVSQGQLQDSPGEVEPQLEGATRVVMGPPNVTTVVQPIQRISQEDITGP